MVASKLDPAILYKETDDIDDEDVEFDSSLYDITLKKLNLNLTIALGKQKMTYIKRNVIYSHWFGNVSDSQKCDQ